MASDAPIPPESGRAPRSLVARLRARCGEFWWWTALIFVSCRAGDAINAFIGLWLVPRCVGSDELGAALPLMQACSAFGLPVAILVIPFSRWLTLYAAAGQIGKVKRLLWLVLGGVAAAFLLAILAARFVMPGLFERLRVEEGSLGLLIVGAGLVGPCSTAFTNALQGLKRFGALALANAVAAPARLVAMLAAMPFRALSGYVVGQAASPAVNVAISAAALRKDLGGGVKSVPLGRGDVLAMVRYTIPIAAYVTAGTLLSAWQTLLFRQRLPEVESAAFYVISRLAEVAAYAGISISLVAFPMAAEAGRDGADAMPLLRKMILGTLLPGFALTALFAVAGAPIMRLVPVWEPYGPYSGLLAAYSARVTLIAAVGVFASFQIAAARFGFMWYWLPLTIADTGVLVALTGYGAFEGVLPDAAVEWMRSLNAATLPFFVWWLVASGAAMAAAVALHIAAIARRESQNAS